jgi:hypothetical protein
VSRRFLFLFASSLMAQTLTEKTGSNGHRRMADEFGLDLPLYPSTDQIVEIPVLAEKP